MKLIKILTAFIALASLQIAAAQWLNVPPPAEARNLMVVGGGVPVAGGCGACNPSNDSIIVNSGNTTDGYADKAGVAYQFTTAAQKCVTGVYLNVQDVNDRGVVGEIWTDNAGSLGAIVGVGFTGTLADVPDTQINADVLFAATQTLEAGTYWVRFMSTGATLQYGAQVTGGSGTFLYSGGGDFYSDTEKYEMGVIGCSP
jgi:hypothetical protein